MEALALPIALIIMVAYINFIVALFIILMKLTFKFIIKIMDWRI